MSCTKYIKSEEFPLSYLYNRVHSQAYPEAFKNGWTSNLALRDGQYKTGELRPGVFADVYECLGEMNGRISAEWLESHLQDELRKYDAQLYFGGGTEFFDITKKCYVEKFINSIKTNNPSFHCVKLTDVRIEELIKQNKSSTSLSKQMDDLEREKLISSPKPRINESQSSTEKTYIPRDYQTEMIRLGIDHLEKYDKGILEIPCGVGKTLLSIWIGIKLNAKTILVGVPTTQLVEQWKFAFSKVFSEETLPAILCIGVGVTIEKIKTFLQNNANNPNGYVVITTYASSSKVLKATKSLMESPNGFNGTLFYLKIYDEVHHLTTGDEMRSQEEDRRTWTKIMLVTANKTLSLTATLKTRDETKPSQINNTITNDDVEHFGSVILKRDVLWAIKNDIICDYVIQVLKVNGDEGTQIDSIFRSLDAYTDTDKRLCLSAYSTLESVSKGHSHRLLIFCNSTENSVKTNHYISELISKGYFELNLFHSSYTSTITDTEQKRILSQFEESQYSIITCVYCLGEGWDFPLLDGVVFAENMTSNIRIVQSALRASRKNQNFLDKRAKIILPVLDLDEYGDGTQTPDLLKVREVVRQMGMEDAEITQKLRVYKLSPTKSPKMRDPKPDPYVDLGEYEEELTKILLKTITRNLFGVVGYEKARSIIAEHGVKNKPDYKLLCEKNNKLPIDPEDAYREKFKSWIDYLSISKNSYYTLEECRMKVREHLESRPELQQKCTLHPDVVCEELTHLDSQFPPNGLWSDMYERLDLGEILKTTPKRKMKIRL